MPNPIKPHIAITSPLAERHFSLIGKISASWNMLELEMSLMVASLTASKVKATLFVFENMTT